MATGKQRFCHKWSYGGFLFITFLTLSGFTLVPDIDRTNHKKITTNNNAKLNDASVSPSALIPRPDLSRGLVAAIPSVHYATILQLHQSLFVGIDATPQQTSPQTVSVNRIRLWLSHRAPSIKKIYVSMDSTLVNHFHRYAADYAVHLHVSSDIALADIEREFPGAQ